jgi:hypothetical protein
MMGDMEFLAVIRGSTAMPPGSKDDDSPSLLGKVSQAAVDRVLCWAPISRVSGGVCNNYRPKVLTKCSQADATLLPQISCPPRGAGWESDSVFCFIFVSFSSLLFFVVPPLFVKRR